MSAPRYIVEALEPWAGRNYSGVSAIIYDRCTSERTSKTIYRDQFPDAATYLAWQMSLVAYPLLAKMFKVGDPIDDVSAGSQPKPRVEE